MKIAGFMAKMIQEIGDTVGIMKEHQREEFEKFRAIAEARYNDASMPKLVSIMLCWESIALSWASIALSMFLIPFATLLFATGMPATFEMMGVFSSSRSAGKTILSLLIGLAVWHEARDVLNEALAITVRRTQTLRKLMHWNDVLQVLGLALLLFAIFAGFATGTAAWFLRGMGKLTSEIIIWGCLVAGGLLMVYFGLWALIWVSRSRFGRWVALLRKCISPRAK